jgi:hypothetical protein
MALMNFRVLLGSGVQMSTRISATLTEVFRGLAQSVQANVGIVP